MRVLILSAVLALATAAPSGDAKPELAVLPIVTPTIDPGDIQAAAINAQVAAEDQARAAADKVVEENNEKVIESDSLVKEKTEEAFWAGEDKKWQTLDAVQTVEAKLDGAVASNADAIARSALGGVVLPTYVVPSLPSIPIVRTPIVPGFPIVGPPQINSIGPISPIIYPGIIAKKEENENIVKTAEPEKPKVLETDKIVSTTPIANNVIDKTNANEAVEVNSNDTEKEKQVQRHLYPHIISYQLVYDPYFFVKKGEKIVKTAELKKDSVKVLRIYPASLVTVPISPSIVYTTSVLAKNEDSKENEIDRNDGVNKEENKLEEKKDEKPQKKVENSLKELESPVITPFLPLVAPQPWPLPGAPIYVPQTVLTRVGREFPGYFISPMDSSSNGSEQKN